MFRRTGGLWLVAFLGLVLSMVGTLQAQAPERPEGERPGERPDGQGRRGRFPGGPGGSGGFAGGGDLFGLLGIEQVQKELEIIDDQRDQLRKLGEELRSRQQGGGGFDFQALRDLSEEEREKRIAEFREQARERAKQREARLAEVLLPHQMDRLKQISIQLRGIGALADPEVAEQLGLSEEQRDRMTQVQTEAREQFQAMFREAGQGGDREALREKMESMRRENEEKIIGVLTKEQHAKFEDMKGPKIEIDRNALFGSRGGPGGDRRGPPSGDRRGPQDGERRGPPQREGGNRPRGERQPQAE